MIRLTLLRRNRTLQRCSQNVVVKGQQLQKLRYCRDNVRKLLDWLEHKPEYKPKRVEIKLKIISCYSRWNLHMLNSICKQRLMSASASLSVSSSRAFQAIASAGREGPRTLLMTRSAVAGAIHSLECMPASIQIAGLDRSSPPICCHAHAFHRRNSDI